MDVVKVDLMLTGMLEAKTLGTPRFTLPENV
jgi:hypothetical protein